MDLTRDLATLAEHAPHDPDLAETVRRRARDRRPVLMPLAAAAAVLLVAGAAYGATRPDPAPPAPGASVSAACPAPTTGVLPTWARAGFSAPYEATYATSRSGDVVAVLFVDLRQPQVEGTSNKVLWVSREPVGTPVTVTGRLLGSSQTMRTTLESGLGPSYVDVPAAGCWRLTLRWDGGSDRIDLRYAPNP